MLENENREGYLANAIFLPSKMKPPLRLTLIYGEKIHDIKLHFLKFLEWKKSLETCSTVPMSDKGVIPTETKSNNRLFNHILHSNIWQIFLDFLNGIFTVIT